LSGSTDGSTSKTCRAAVRGTILGWAQQSVRGEPTLGDALRAAVDVRDAADAYLRELVDMARNDGATWAEIGEAIGVTTQAAHQRYGPRSARH
jgi:hypothetical protein